MFDDIGDLYQELIVDHNARPHNFGVIEGVSHKAHGLNPLCGDDIKIFLKVDGKTIEDISFTGEGCAICKASASIMTDEVRGKTLKEAQELFEVFHTLIAEEDISELDVDNLGKLSAFSGVRNFPMRVKCATLAWHTMRAALENKNDDVTTE